jgi:hypothetical protein
VAGGVVRTDPELRGGLMPRGKTAQSLALIEAAREILSEIQPATVRAVCYRLFTQGLIESMAKSNTNRVSTQLVYAREQGLIRWDWIVDETREAERVATWADPERFIDTVERSYRRDRWNEQPERMEVWSEKGTVRGTVAPILRRYAVTFRVLHGYGSATALYEAAEDSRATDQPLSVLYVGDWDPSGLHMSEVDLPARLERYGGELTLVRAALTAEDVADPDLPWFEAETKRHDPRWGWFVNRYGTRCWELDALNPNLLRNRIAGEIERRVDHDAWARAGRVEAAERASLTEVLGNWRQAISMPATKYGAEP